MLKRPCLDCGRPSYETRCIGCSLIRRRRLYGGQHQTSRTSWQRYLDHAYTPTHCAIPECTHPHDPIDPTHWDLDHRTSQPAHPDCNRASGGRGDG